MDQKESTLPKAGSNMRQRIVTATIALPIALTALLCANPWPLAALACLLAVAALTELGRLIETASTCLFAPGLAVAIYFVAIRGQQPTPIIGVLWLTFLIGVWCAWFSRTTAHRVMASFWILSPLAALVELHQRTSSDNALFAPTPILLAVVPLWFGDTAAIFAGRAFGKHLMAPTISPKKTWEGGIANLVCCIIAAWVIGSSLDLPTSRSVLCGLACGIFGQAGDLFESSMKRRVGVKDSGELLPGHGGVLDRIDSLLFTALPVASIVLLQL